MSISTEERCGTSFFRSGASRVLETVVAWAVLLLFPLVWLAGVATWFFGVYQLVQMGRGGFAGHPKGIRGRFMKIG